MLVPQVRVTPRNLPLEERPILQVPGRLKRGNPDAQQDDRAKRTRYYESEDSEEDEPDKTLAEEFDPESYYHANRKLKLSESLQKYVDTHFRSCLSREVHRAMARDNPLPDTPSLHPPEMDDVLVDYMGSDFPSSSEEHYKRIQTAVISARAPMLNLWAHLEEQQLTVGQGGLIQTEVVLEMIQKSLVLLGNASNYVSETRRDLIIGKLSKKRRSLGRVLKSACKKNKPEGAMLFGPAVYKAISERVDTLTAFNKTAGKAQGGNQMESFFEGARLSETVGSRTSSQSRSTILVRESMCPPNPNIGGAPSFANSSPQRNLSRRHAYSTPTLNNTPTPSSDLSPQYSSLILSSNFSRSNISYFPPSPRVTSLWGSPAVLHRSLEQDYARPLGSAGGAWIPTGFLQPSPPTQTQIYPTGPSKGPKTGYGVGNPVTAGETGNNSPDTPSFSRVLQQCVCGTEEGWGLETHNQFEGAEQVCYLSPLQDGEYLQLERCHLARGLNVQNRFKRCLPVCPIAQIRLEISPLQLGGEVLPVQNPPIRPHLSPVCVYQTPPPSCRTVQAGWSENLRLPGRLATIGIRPRFTERPRRVRLIDLAFTGISIESQEMYHGANSINRVSRLHNRLQEDDPVPAGSQGRQDTLHLNLHFITLSMEMMLCLGKSCCTLSIQHTDSAS